VRRRATGGVKPVASGDNSFDNLVTACLECNSKKNNKRLGDYLADEGGASGLRCGHQGDNF